MYKRVIATLFWLSIFFTSSYGAEQMDSGGQTTWIALFVLGAVCIVILFFFSRQLVAAKALHEDMARRQLEMEEGQTTLLTNMSENIFKITKEAIESHSTIIQHSKDQSIEQVLEQVIKAENKMLDRTHDLIDFLRLKSKKIEISNASFNLNNVLNEVAGSVCSNYKGSPVELIFDIDNNIPKTFIGDSLHLGQIFNNLLDYSLSRTMQGEIKLKISIFKTFDDNTQLQFQISDTSEGLDEQSLEKLFMPYYDEESKEYVGLGLYVAQQLVGLMGGEIMVQSMPSKGTRFNFVMPLKIADVNNRRNYRLPEKIMTTKKVYIVDNNYSAALAIKKLFAYFKHDVHVVSKEKFVLTKPRWETYDIILLSEDMFSPKIEEYLQELRAQRELKVIRLTSLLSANTNSIEESSEERLLVKPLNQERVFDLIVDMFSIDVNKVLLEESIEADGESDKKSEKSILVHRKGIPETKNIVREQFADFSGSKLLIVEDNLINQKVLTTILDKSGIEISIANNGEEALTLITNEDIEFDIVLMDINMPVMDGFSATKHIRATGKFDHLPIISFTALVLESEVDKMFNAGVNAFLSKPLNIGKLYSAFDMFIDKKPIDKPIEAIQIEDTKELEGIDIEEGIKYANDNEALYIEVLKEFIEYYGQTGELFEKLANEKRYEQLKMLCLDMKGLTGTIGAHDMHNKTDEIYKLFIYGKHSLLPNHTKDYQQELTKLVDSINIYLKRDVNYSK